MSLGKINKTFQQVAKDGRVGKKDVENLIKQSMDGRGITRSEGEKLKKLRAEHADKFTTAGAAAFDRFLSKMNRSWSSKKSVHLPNFDEGQLKELIASDPRIGIYTGRSSGGKGASTAPADPDPAPVSGGGKSGGSTTPDPVTPDPVSGGGKSGGSTTPDPVTPDPVSGGGKGGGGGSGGSVGGGGGSVGGGGKSGGAWTPTPVSPPVSTGGK